MWRNKTPDRPVCLPAAGAYRPGLVVPVCPSALCRDQTGFTLVELLLALLLFGIISGVIFATFAAISKGVERGRDSTDFYHVGRAAMRRLVQEMAAAFIFIGSI